MNAESAPALTDLIHRARQGEDLAARELYAAVYPELRRLARSRLRRHARQTLLDTTELVHEAYLRLVGNGRLQVTDRVHFMGYAGKVMRSVCVDLARQRQAQRRGGDERPVTLDENVPQAADQGNEEILAVHGALDQLARYDSRLVQVVELRYFAGMTDVQVAEALGVAERTVRRDWEKARLLLAEALL